MSLPKSVRNLSVAALTCLIVAAGLFVLPVGGFIHIGKPISFQPSGDESIPTWLIAGPFGNSGDNALFRDYLWWAGGEAKIKPREGDIAAIQPRRIIRWQRQPADSDGRIDFQKLWGIKYHSTAYAYTEIESDSDRCAVATVLGGMNLQVWLNGRVVYENRLLRNEVIDKDAIVLNLRKGTNRLLVKAQELVQQFWRMELKTHLPAGKLFVNEKNSIVPDFIVSQQLEEWGQIEIANASTEDLTGVTVEVAGGDLVATSHSAPTLIGAGMVQRIPVMFSTVRAVPDTVSEPIQMLVKSGDEAFHFDIMPKLRKPSEYLARTFRSQLDGSVQPYSIWLPAEYDPAKTYALLVLLHGSTVDDWRQNIFAYSPKEWAIEIAPHDRGDNFFREAGEVDLDEMIADAQRVFKTDPDRVYLSGHSMGGYGTWYQATRRPDKWAAIAAQSGATDESYERPDLCNSSGDEQRRFQEQTLRGWSPINFAENMACVPAYALHGGSDPEIPPAQSRQMCQRLAAFGYEQVYDEARGQIHWWGGPPHTDYGAECVDKPAMTNFLRDHGPREKDPKHIVYVTDSLRYNKAYWVTIDQMDSVSALARVEATIAGQDIEVKESNVAQITLNPDVRKFELGKGVRIKIDDDVAFVGALPESGLTLRKDAGRFLQAERYPPDAGFNKTHDLFGPVADAFNKPFLFIIGTGGQGPPAAETNSAATEAARVLARDWMLRANGIVNIKNDSDVTNDEIQSRNLVLFGNADTNSIIGRINGQLPIKFAAGGIVVGQRTFGSDTGMIMIAPNPLNPARYVVIVGGSSPGCFQAAGRTCMADLPDYVVFDANAFSGKKLAFLAGGFFDKYWRVDEQISG
ncbi:MAG TPA: prolyl oligopeptidase family serine peptidase [Blastocatellia bacterium]